MKLRCTHNSIRIRVRKSDLAVLDQAGRVSASVQFGPMQVLTFELIRDIKYTSVKANMENGNIWIELPEKMAHNWAHSQEVGIEAQQELPEGNSLHILLEKDFPCLDREEENKSDTFWELAPDQPEAC